MKTLRASVATEHIGTIVTFAYVMNQHLARPLQERSFQEFLKSFPRATVEPTLPYFALGKLHCSASASTTGRISISMVNDTLTVTIRDIGIDAPPELNDVYNTTLQYFQNNLQMLPELEVECRDQQPTAPRTEGIPRRRRRW